MSRKQLHDKLMEASKIKASWGDAKSAKQLAHLAQQLKEN